MELFGGLIAVAMHDSIHVFKSQKFTYKIKKPILMDNNLKVLIL